jgi:hypothetical protein
MTFSARAFCGIEDYEMVCKWWKDWNWPIMAMNFLPTTGLIVSNEEKNLCAAWLYITDSDFCIIDWFISNKKASKEERKGSVEFLIEKLSEKAKDFGFKTIFTWTKNQILIKKLENFGYSKETEVTILEKRYD